MDIQSIISALWTAFKGLEKRLEIFGDRNKNQGNLDSGKVRVQEIWRDLLSLRLQSKPTSKHGWKKFGKSKIVIKNNRVSKQSIF